MSLVYNVMYNAHIRKEVMMGIPENIDALLIKYDIQANALARIADVSESTVTRWRKGGKIRQQNLDRITGYFGLVDDDILSDSVGLAAQEHGRAVVMPKGARRMVASEPAFLPLRGKVHAGDACEPDVFDDLVECPASIAAGHPNAYFLRVEGDCMSRIYPEGSLILIDPDMVPQDGSIAVVSIDGADFVMRRLRKGSRTLMLCPDSYSDEYDDIVVDPDEHTIEFVATVVWYQPEREMG